MIGSSSVLSLVPQRVWSKRYEMINDFEKMLYENGTRILKFYLHVSPAERFKQRLEERRATGESARPTTRSASCGRTTRAVQLLTAKTVALRRLVPRLPRSPKNDARWARICGLFCILNTTTEKRIEALMLPVRTFSPRASHVVRFRDYYFGFEPRRVEGDVVTRGLEQALWCDLRVEASNAVLGVSCGIGPGARRGAKPDRIRRRFGLPCSGALSASNTRSIVSRLPDAEPPDALLSRARR